jgi:hypothetical protein
MKAGRVKTEDIGQDLLVTRNEVSICRENFSLNEFIPI